MQESQLDRLSSSRSLIGPSAWPLANSQIQSRIETMQVRDGLTIIVSDITGECAREYHHEESEDVLGIGFHLLGGAQFGSGNHACITSPYDVWVGASPKSASSMFVLPASGFRTVALRFDPETAVALLDELGPECVNIAELARTAGHRATLQRFAGLSARSAAIAEEMLASPYSGSARRLHYESAALALLIDLASDRPQAAASRQQSLQRRLHEAREHLDAHLCNPPTIVQLARIVGINDFTLKRAFKEHFGTTVFGYVRQRRMEQAHNNLDAGMSVGAAATSVGYECPRCFADAFRRHFGLLPSETGPRARLPARNR